MGEVEEKKERNLTVRLEPSVYRKLLLISREEGKKPTSFLRELLKKEIRRRERRGEHR